MPHGVVLLPDRDTHARLAALAARIAGPDPINKLGPHAPAHVSVAHFDGGDPTRIATRTAAHPVRTLTVRIIGLLYTQVPPGDYYVPEGGVYFGLEVVRRPDLNALHHEALAWIADTGAKPLGAVGTDFRPHITLGMTRTPVFPDPSAIPTGDLDLRLAFGELGPYGTFPNLTN